MKQEFVNKVGSKHLLLIFAGWGTDSTFFKNLTHSSYDIVVVWDYKDSEKLADFDEYDEICVIAWSLGVLAAPRILQHFYSKLGRCIAVNGTPWSVDNERGIPVAIFQGTLDNLNERNLVKFRRRMCGDEEKYNEFSEHLPSRTLDDLRDELKFLGDLAKQQQPAFSWDLAIVSLRDGIYPLNNQRNAWASTQTIEIDWPHLPDFSYIISHFLIDKPLVGKRFTEAVDTYDTNASVQSAIAGELWQEIGLTDWAKKHPRFTSSYNASTVIEIGSGTGIFTSLYAPDIDGNCDWQLWDIADLHPAAVKQGARFIKCDAERAIRKVPDSSVDYILSNCAVQWFNSPQRFLEECARALKPDGVLAFSTFDPNNLPELKIALPDLSQLTTPSVEQWSEMIPEGLELMSIKRNSHPLLFSTPRDVLQHMKGTGVNALMRPSVSSLRGFISRYPSLYDGYPLTYISIILVLRRSN